MVSNTLHVPGGWSDVDALEQRFGDPWSVDNPLGYKAVLDADERGVPFTAGESAFKETVAVAGCRPESLVALLRVVGRRDLSLALRCAAEIDGNATVTSAVCIASLDTCLRATLRHALRRRLYSVSMAELPAVRNVLVGAFVELLASDALCLAALRAPLFMPSERTVADAAAAHHVCMTVEAVDRLSEVMGAYFYVREGQTAIFQKHLRDLKQGALANPALPALHQALLANLDSFAHGDPLPGGHLAGLVASAADACEGGRGSPGLVSAFAALADDFDALATYRSAVPSALGDGQPDALERTDWFASLLAAASCAGVWLNNPLDPFISSSSWLLLALYQLSRDPRPWPAADEAEVLKELLARHGQPHGIGLIDRCFPG
jgi:hypothetical protein